MDKKSPDPSQRKPLRNGDLEEIVHLANKVGQEYAKAKQCAERMDLLKPSMKARIALRIDDGQMSEAKLKRLTENDPEYVKYLEEFAEAKGASDRFRIRYESYCNLFEAKRSMLSYKKTEMSLL